MFNPEFLKRMGYDKLGDLSKLFPRGEREKWEKIAFPAEIIAAAPESKTTEKRQILRHRRTSLAIR